MRFGAFFINPVGILPTGRVLTIFAERIKMSTQETFALSLCIFIAECMCIVSMTVCKTTAIKSMADRANAIFKNFPKTPGRVQEVKDVIVMMAA